MRYLMTAFATLSLGALPMTAQVPARPTPPNPPAQPAAPPAPITEQQRQQHQAIREKYAKEMQVHRDAIQALNEKMRTEIDATLTPEQRQFREQRAGRRGLGFGRGMGMAQGGGWGMGQGVGRGQGQAMLMRRADRAAREIITMRDRMALHGMMMRRGLGQMGQGNMMAPGAAMGGRGPGFGQGNMMGPGQGMGGRGGMMNGMGPGQPSAAAKQALPSKAPAAPAPVKKPAKTGGGGN